MSVTPMKLVTVVGPLSAFDTVVHDCIINREFHPESAISVMKKVKFLLPFDLHNPYADLLRRAEQLADRSGITLAYSPFEKQQDPDAISGYFDELGAQIGALSAKCDELERSLMESEQVLRQLDHVKDISVPLQDFFSFTYVKFRFGRMPRELYDSFIDYLNDRKDTFFFETSIERDYVYGMYMTPRAHMERVDAMFTSMQFERIRLSERIVGTSEDAAETLEAGIAEAREEIQSTRKALENLRRDERERFLSCYSYVRYMNDSFNLRRYAAHTEDSFYILGWVPLPEYQSFVGRIDALDNVNFITVADDADAVVDYTPPVKLKNNRIFRPFESFVGMYGLPSYSEIDPTPLMAITYTVIFGIMFGDVGQGALLVLVGLLMWKLKGMWLGPLVGYMGFGSIVFGFVYGSVFGYEDILPGFKVLEGDNASFALQTAVYLGVGLVALVIVLNIVNGFQQRNIEKAVFGANGIAGLLLYIVVVLLALPIIGFGANLFPVGRLGIFAGILALLVFLREPLSRLCARRKDWLPHSPAGFVLENFFEMFEVLLSYITNTISFLRVGAYMISHASMMAVVFMLARGPDGTENFAVIIIGNLIVMGIEGLLVGIQTLRLEFYELFGRFYTGGGRSYTPVIVNYSARDESG